MTSELTTVDTLLRTDDALYTESTDMVVDAALEVRPERLIGITQIGPVLPLNVRRLRISEDIWSKFLPSGGQRYYQHPYRVVYPIPAPGYVVRFINEGMFEYFDRRADRLDPLTVSLFRMAGQRAQGLSVGIRIISLRVVSNNRNRLATRCFAKHCNSGPQHEPLRVDGSSRKAMESCWNCALAKMET